MTDQITASVGMNGVNGMGDVQTVQLLLLGKGYMVVPYGLVDQLTISAITMFQGTFLNHPDGRIDPGGKSWKMLTGQTAAPPTTPAPGSAPVMNGYLEELSRPEKGTYNIGLTPVSNQYLINKYGKPRDNFSQDDQPVTNARLKTLMKTENIGPFKVNGLAAAVDSLKLVFSDIKDAYPELYPMIGYAGMLVVRYVRGSTTTISNHSWGTAVDLKISGILDKRGDNKVQKGLTLIAPIFNNHKWYWGVDFGKEDAMHFECSRELIATFPS